jgi:cation diffusion facilitator family transporter
MSLAQPDAGADALKRQVTAFSVITALVLTALKASVWLASGSVGLLASLADSGLDLIASGATFFAVRYAAVPPDAEHRFGHGKAEAFASLLQAGLVFASAALVGQEAVRRLLLPRPVTQEGLAMWAMAASILLTGTLIAAQSRLLRRTGSVAISADRTHYGADLASNAVVLAGVAGAAVLHEPRLDALAGLMVAAILLWGAVLVFREASGQLMDRELPRHERSRIIGLIKQDPRISGVHQLRTRLAGPITHMQMHADLDPELSLIDAHKVIVAAERRVLEAFPAADILIHPDPRGRAEPHGGAFTERHGESEPA